MAFGAEKLIFNLFYVAQSYKTYKFKAGVEKN